MKRHRELRKERCWERLEESFRRYSVVCSSLGRLAEAFEKTPEFKGDAFEAPAHMVGALPDALLVRAIAEEGLALGEQITWEAHLIEGDEELVKLSERSRVLSFLQKAKSEVESRKAWFEQTCAQMNKIIGVTMDAAGALKDVAGRLRSLDDKKEKP